MINSKYLLSLVLSQFLGNSQNLDFGNLSNINFHSAVFRLRLNILIFRLSLG